MSETLNTKPLIEIAQHANLLDTTGEAFSAAALANPQGIAINFAKGIIASEDAREELIRAQEVAAVDAVFTPEGILKRLHHIVKNARQVGYDVTVTADATDPNAFPHINLTKIEHHTPTPTPTPAPSETEAPSPTPEPTPEPTETPAPTPTPSAT